VDSIRTAGSDGEVMLVGQNMSRGSPIWAFGQLRRSQALRLATLRDLTCYVGGPELNHGLANRLQDAKGPRSVKTSIINQRGQGDNGRECKRQAYSRIGLREGAERYPRDDISRVGTPINRTFNKRDEEQRTTPALYASDHDLFAFIPERPGCWRRPGKPARDFCGGDCGHLEVGERKSSSAVPLREDVREITLFWGAQDVIEMSSRHMR